MRRIKMVLIGAGSASFTAGLLADVLSSTVADEWTIGLVDTNPEALEVARGLAARMVAKRDAPVELIASTDRQEALPGADVVVTTIGVGGRRAWEHDVYVPRRHGVFQPVGDTVMAGGISRALRQIPPMVEIAHDVHRLCPGAWFFNYANPMSAICRAIGKATPARVVGLCHGVQGTLRYLCDVAGVPWTEAGALYCGINHLTWITHLTHQGRSLWPRIDDGLEKRSADDDNPFSWELYRTYRAFPAVLDRHVTEFFPECFPGGRYYGRTLGVDVFSMEDTIENGDRAFERMAAQAAGTEPLSDHLFERALGEHEALIDIIGSVLQDRQRIFPMNVPNTAVPGIPSGFVVEAPVAATAAGCVPLSLPELPAGILATITEALYGVEITVDAALAGDRDLFVQALLYDRCVTSRAAAESLADDLLVAHRDHLPQFA